MLGHIPTQHLPALQLLKTMATLDPVKGEFTRKKEHYHQLLLWATYMMTQFKCTKFWTKGSFHFLLEGHKSQVSLTSLYKNIVEFHFLNVVNKRTKLKRTIKVWLSSRKGDQFFPQMSDFCENCNAHSSYHTTTIDEFSVHIRLAETCKLTLFTFLKIFIGLKNGRLLHSQTGGLSMRC